MNEIRMYVEHLFEGKLLTADIIELEEELTETWVLGTRTSSPRVSSPVTPLLAPRRA